MHARVPARALALALTGLLLSTSVALARDDFDADRDVLTVGAQGGALNLTLSQGGTATITVGAMITLGTGGGSNAGHVTFPVPVSVTETDTEGILSGLSPISSSIAGYYDPSQAYPADNQLRASATVTAPVGLACGVEHGFSARITFTVTDASDAGNLDQSARSVPVSLTVPASSCPPANSRPSVTVDAASVTVGEGTEATLTGTWADADAGDSVALDASVGVVVKAGTNASGTWSWSYTPDDGPTDSQPVVITAEDNSGTANAGASTSFDLVVTNVAPSAFVTASPALALVGQTVTYTASADDVSSADDAAGFRYSFDSGPWTTRLTTASVTAAYTSCGTRTMTARAEDKDGGVSSVATSNAVQVFDASFLAPIRERGFANLVQKGRVIPVQITVSCEGPIAGLTPRLTLLSGDHDNDADASSADNLVAATANAADSSGVMREVDGKYMYNLRIPDNLSTGQLLTVRVQPWGSSGPSMYALLEVRK